MKTVINGKLYNTETATRIVVYANDFPVRDFRACVETLYRTKRGVCFLHGKGGPMTQWRKRAGDMYTSGEGTQALSDGKALQWCEDRDIDADVIAANFDIEEG